MFDSSFKISDKTPYFKALLVFDNFTRILNKFILAQLKALSNQFFRFERNIFGPLSFA